jgi:hypothetical protein
MKEGRVPFFVPLFLKEFEWAIFDEKGLQRPIVETSMGITGGLQDSYLGNLEKELWMSQVIRERQATKTDELEAADYAYLVDEGLLYLPIFSRSRCQFRDGHQVR